MSAPDELAEMKRYGAFKRALTPTDLGFPFEVEVYVRADADRVIAREKAGWAEAFRLAVFHQERADKAEAALASRDAQLAEARELLQEAYEDGQLWRGERIYGHIRPDSKLTCPMQPNVPAEPSGGEK